MHIVEQEKQNGPNRRESLIRWLMFSSEIILADSIINYEVIKILQFTTSYYIIAYCFN